MTLLRTKLATALLDLRGIDEKLAPQDTIELGLPRTIGNVQLVSSLTGEASRTVDETRTTLVEHNLQGPRVIARTVTARQAIFEDRSPLKLESNHVENTTLPEMDILVSVLRSVLQESRLCRLLNEVSRYTSQEQLHVELREVFESYIHRLSRTRAFLKLDIPSDPSGNWERWLVAELTTEVSRSLNSTGRQGEVGSGILVDKDQKRVCGRLSLRKYLLNPESQRQQLDLKALNAFEGLLLEDEPFENMCEDVKDMILRHRPCKDKAPKTSGGQGEEKDYENVSVTIGHEDSYAANLDPLTDDRSVISARYIFGRFTRNLYDGLYPVKVGYQRVRWQCVSLLKTRRYQV